MIQKKDRDLQHYLDETAAKSNEIDLIKEENGTLTRANRQLEKDLKGR